MNALIVEDEALAREHLEQLILECDPTAHIVDRLDSVEDTIGFFKSGKQTDILFLDIQLADGKSFEIFDSVKVDVPIIFTTAYDQYTLQAFKQNSIDYLLKPIQRADLNFALDKYKRIASRSHLKQEDIALFKSLIQNAKRTFKERFIIKSGNKLQYKPVQEVAYFFADGKTTFLVSKKENRKYLIDYSLEELEDQLDPDVFFRISRKVIVGIDSIAEIKGLISTRLELRLHQPVEFELTVSRERAQRLKEWLNK